MSEELNKTNICERCKKSYKPAFDFVEEVEILNSIQRYINIETHCPDCIYELDEKIHNFINEL